MKDSVKIISIIVSALCVGVLVYLVFFFGEANAPQESITTQKLTDYEITFETPELEYKDSVDFLDGAKAVDENGVDLTNEITVSCKPTKNISRKTLTYSINKAGYRFKTFERELVISSSYTGPSIKPTGEAIKIPINKLENATQIVAASQSIATDDGFGNTCSISVSLPQIEEIGDYVATVEASNIFGDSAVCKITVSIIEAENTTIRLSASSISIGIGEKFDASKYILSASNDEYSDLTPYIVIDSDVDTSKPGVYTVKYSIRGIPELKDETAYLYVTVM